jgi:hypothetical protein
MIPLSGEWAREQMDRMKAAAAAENKKVQKQNSIFPRHFKNISSCWQ